MVGDPLNEVQLLAQRPAPLSRVSREVRETVALIDTLSEHLSLQSGTVAEIGELASVSNLAVADGVSELRRALSSPRSLRDFAVMLALSASLLLIFLDWYSP